MFVVFVFRHTISSTLDLHKLLKFWFVGSVGLFILLEITAVLAQGPYQISSGWYRIFREWNAEHRDWQDMATSPTAPPTSKPLTNKHLFYLRSAPTPNMPVAVVKWWHPKDRDWVTIPSQGTGHIADATLKQWGYRSPHLLGYASLHPFRHSVAVYRWWHPGDRDWVTIPSHGPGHIPDATLKQWGYISPVWMFHAHANPVLD